MKGKKAFCFGLYRLCSLLGKGRKRVCVCLLEIDCLRGLLLLDQQQQQQKGQLREEAKSDCGQKREETLEDRGITLFVFLSRTHIFFLLLLLLLHQAVNQKIQGLYCDRRVNEYNKSQCMQTCVLFSLRPVRACVRAWLEEKERCKCCQSGAQKSGS